MTYVLKHYCCILIYNFSKKKINNDKHWMLIMHCYETELVKLQVNVFTPTLNFLIFVSNQTINIVNTMTVHMYVMYCYIIYMCLLFTLIKVIIHWPFIPPLIISAIRGSIKSVTCTKPGIWISTLIFRTPIILLILNRLSFVFVGRLFSWLLFINNFYVQTSSILCFTFATNKFVPWREIWLPSETTNLLTALPLADKPVFSQTVTIVLSMYLYCNNTTHFNIFSLSSISLTVRNGRESTILANVP